MSLKSIRYRVVLITQDDGRKCRLTTNDIQKKHKHLVAVFNRENIHLHLDSNYSSHWSTDGCYKSQVFIKNNKSYITCSCDHLTNFAVLLNVHDNEEIHRSVGLATASLIGCYISICSLFITIVSFLGLK